MRLRLAFFSCSTTILLFAFLLNFSVVADSDENDITSAFNVNETSEAGPKPPSVLHDDDSDETDEEEREPSVQEDDYQHREKFFDEKLEEGMSRSVNPISIGGAFNTQKTFSCPRIKSDLVTGTSIGDLSPEDIGIIAAMGDSLSTGIGLWPRTNIEFRGASFASGGDATIDGLVTIPNILREFNKDLLGVSHGMGKADQLPEHQLNVARSGANTTDLPSQAKELVERLEKSVLEVDYKKQWIMIIITIGTEEVCDTCTGADYRSISEALKILQRSIPKAFVVLLGPLHVSPMKLQHENWLSKRCRCLQDHAQQVAQNWTEVFDKIQKDFFHVEGNTFGVQALPFLTITSRFPSGLFLAKKPLLNRRGHMYATKWLWNRLIAGSKYNLSEAILSQDTYFCPSTGCPYFRTTANMNGCQLLSQQDAKEKFLVVSKDGTQVLKRPRRTKKMLYMVAFVIVSIAFCMVFLLGSIFYQRSKMGDHGRFEVIEEAQLKFEEAKKEEERTLLTRQNTRALSADILGRSTSFSSKRVVSECEA